MFKIWYYCCVMIKIITKILNLNEKEDVGKTISG